jgi:prepilin-type N-terminal cleavage/methylation domain-containing protein
VTLVELLVVIAIIGIMTAVGLTSMRPGPSKVKSAALNFRSRMMLAKSEAIKRNEDIEITFNTGNGTYVARDSDTEIVFSAGLDSDLTMATNNTSITFKPLGTASTSSFWIRGYGKSYKVSINNVGKIKIE